MSPELRAAYERLYRRELACREELFKAYPTILVNEIADAYGNRVPTAATHNYVESDAFEPGDWFSNVAGTIGPAA